MNPLPVKEGWWEETFPAMPAAWKAPGKKHMLTLIAYDIACPRRLNKVAKTCQDFGARVQYSIFECHLEPSEFDSLWLRLNDLIEPKEDRLVAYRLGSRSARKTLTAGTMVCTRKVVCYLV